MYLALISKVDFFVSCELFVDTVDSSNVMVVKHPMMLEHFHYKQGATASRAKFNDFVDLGLKIM